MNKLGVIADIKDNNAIVMLGSSSSCGNCGCSVKFRKDGEICEGSQVITVANSIGAKIGDPVNIEFKTGEMLKTSVMLYLLPLLMLVVGIMVGSSLKFSDILSFGLGIFMLALSYFALSMVDKKKDKDQLIVMTEFKGY